MISRQTATSRSYLPSGIRAFFLAEPFGKDGNGAPVFDTRIHVDSALSIEALRKQENTEQQLGATKSAFESVQATSTEPLPTTIYFVTEPYHGLSERSFVLRLGILTGGDKPTISLRIVNKEQHAEDMAEELAQLVVSAISSCAVDMPVLVGSYSVRG